jgi:predicted nucleic acid-binding protein
MLLDTSGLLCVLNSAEPLHPLACELLSKSTIRLVHSYVIAELLPLSNTRRVSRQKVIDYIAAIVDDPSVELVWVDKALQVEAVSLLDRRPDKDYSLCDAVSFVLMRQYNLTDALTTDKHFEQEGFTRLLK